MEIYMTELEKTGKRIALLRKERGYTGAALAEKLKVSPQAISKWENGKCLPETVILPSLAEALDCSIDSLLCPRELFILEAVYTDGETHIPVTRFLDDLVRDNTLTIYVNTTFVGASLESGRLKMLTVKFQTPEGIFFTHALQNEPLFLNKKSVGFADDEVFQIIGAYYGNEKKYSSVMQKMEHYEYFKWDKIVVNHENFPSDTASDDTEYLTLVYLNTDGIHTISCPENDTIYYGNHHTQLLLQDNSKHILKDIMRLSWGKGMECPWAGSLYAALKYMGEDFTYPQIMGMSGACYRVCFTEVWDYSCTDALVAFDYASPLYRAIGYSFHIVDRLEKQERKNERLAIMKDIQNGKPVLAINLRVAPEWGIITGYTDNGKRFLCRTYFDDEVFNELEQEGSKNQKDRKLVFEDHAGYLFSDTWPFIILHFGEKGALSSPVMTLKASLEMCINSFYAEECRGYHQGKGAYEAWIKGLSKESDFDIGNDRENVLRRLGVNDNMLSHLIDSRRAAALYLRDNIALLSETEKGCEYLEKMVENFEAIAHTVSEFRDKLSSCEVNYNTIHTFGASTPTLRREQISLLKHALVLDEENCRLAECVLKQI